MTIEELRRAFHPPDSALRKFAAKVGIPLEEPASLEKRHPRPWKMKHGSMYDANDERTLVGPHEDESWDALVAAYNREPLLLEIAETAESLANWLGGAPMSPALLRDKLESLLHRLRLEQREEKS